MNRRGPLRLLSSDSYFSVNLISKEKRRYLDVWDYLILTQTHKLQTLQDLTSLISLNQVTIKEKIDKLVFKKLLINFKSQSSLFRLSNDFRSKSILPVPYIQFKLSIKSKPLNFIDLCLKKSWLTPHQMDGWKYFDGDLWISDFYNTEITIYSKTVKICLGVPIQLIPDISVKECVDFLLQYLRKTVRYIYDLFPGLLLVIPKKYPVLWGNKAISSFPITAGGLSQQESNVKHNTNSIRTKCQPEWLIGHAHSQTWVFVERMTFEKVYEIAERLRENFNWKTHPFIMNVKERAHPIDIARWDDIQRIRKAKNIGVNGKIFFYDNPEDEFWRRLTLEKNGDWQTDFSE